MDRVTLWDEYRLIEKSETEINPVWKGAHLLLFFLSFVFGSFCTFCFHVLMHLFNEKCVLFPKLMTLKDLHKSGAQSIILDYIAKKNIDEIPVDFVTTQWVDSKICLLPTYVPLFSGICGIVWTTMFLMCSSGSRTLTGLQRPWRILPGIFVFSLAIGSLSTYTSLVTQYGLEQLCTKLGEFTGTNSCTYTINVATLAYERRIRGVYQATRLTMLSAWLHTCCWLGAALLALVRVILIVDFRLVRVQAQLIGNIEKMLERHEKHIRTDEFGIKDDSASIVPVKKTTTPTKVRLRDEKFGTANHDTVHYFSQVPQYPSQISLVPEENRRICLELAYRRLSNKEHRFIVKLLHDLLDNIHLFSEASIVCEPNTSSVSIFSELSDISLRRQKGQRGIISLLSDWPDPDRMTLVIPDEEAEDMALRFRHNIEKQMLESPPYPKKDSELVNVSDSLKPCLKVKACQTTTNLTTQGTSHEELPNSSKLSKSASLETLKPKEETVLTRDSALKNEITDVKFDSYRISLTASDAFVIKVSKTSSNPDIDAGVRPQEQKRIKNSGMLNSPTTGDTEEKQTHSNPKEKLD